MKFVDLYCFGICSTIINILFAKNYYVNHKVDYRIMFYMNAKDNFADGN